MSDILSDGHVVQDGLNFHKRSNSGAKNMRFIPYPVRAQVLAVYQIDLEGNPIGETTVCNLYVTRLGIPLFAVPVQLGRASLDNYLHWGDPQAATANVDGSTFNPGQLNPAITNGDTVIVDFIDADPKDPVIRSVAPSPQSGYGGISPDPRPVSDDGDILKARYNGTRFIIDKNGNVTFDSSIPAYNKNITKEKKFSVEWSTPDGSQAVAFTLDNTTQEAEISITDGDGNTQSVSIFPTGVTITTSGDGKVTVNSASDVDVNAEGDANITAEGNVNLSGGGSPATLKVLGYPNAISDFTGLPIQAGSSTVNCSE